MRRLKERLATPDRIEQRAFPKGPQSWRPRGARNVCALPWLQTPTASGVPVAAGFRADDTADDQPRGFRLRGWADLVTGGGETVAELVDRHGSELLELPK